MAKNPPVSIIIQDIAGKQTEIVNVPVESLSIDDIIGQTVGSAKFRVYDKHANMDIQELSEVSIYRLDTECPTNPPEKIFGGIISKITKNIEGLSVWWDIQCQDYTVLLDSILTHASFPAGYYTNPHGTTSDPNYGGDQGVIWHIFTRSAITVDGQGPSGILAIPPYVGRAFSDMGPLVFNYTTLREAMQTISGFTGWQYHVDYDKKLWYYLRTNTPAPYVLSDSGKADTIPYRSLKYEIDATQVRNLYVMFGAKLFSNVQTYYLGADGISTIYTLTARDGSIGRTVNFVAPPGQDRITVEVNDGTGAAPIWRPLKVGAEATDRMSDNDVLHNSTQQFLSFKVAPPHIDFVRDAYGNITSYGAIRIQACFMIGAGVADIDNASVARYGRTFARRLSAGDTNSAIALHWKLNNLKAQFAMPMERITIKIDDLDFPVSKPGIPSRRFAPGQWVQIENSVMGLNRNLLIYRMGTRLLGGTHFEYELELRSWISESAA